MSVTERTGRQGELVELFTEICGVLKVEDAQNPVDVGHEVEMTVLGNWPRRVVLSIAEDGWLEWKVLPNYEENDDG